MCPGPTSPGLLAVAPVPQARDPPMSHRKLLPVPAAKRTPHTQSLSPPTVPVWETAESTEQPVGNPLSQHNSSANEKPNYCEQLRCVGRKQKAASISCLFVCVCAFRISLHSINTRSKPDSRAMGTSPSTTLWAEVSCRLHQCPNTTAALDV